MRHILLLFPLQALGAVSHALRRLGLDGASGAVGYWSSLWAIPGIGEAVGRWGGSPPWWAPAWARKACEHVGDKGRRSGGKAGAA